MKAPFITNPACAMCGRNAFGTLYAMADGNGWIYYLCWDCLNTEDEVIT